MPTNTCLHLQYLTVPCKVCFSVNTSDNTALKGTNLLFENILRILFVNNVFWL